MSSNAISNSKTESKLIKCQNCRQDILSSKMFLHEGFCQRNNIFCEHCNKVFLKKIKSNIILIIYLIIILILNQSGMLLH